MAETTATKTTPNTANFTTITNTHSKFNTNASNNSIRSNKSSNSNNNMGYKHLYKQSSSEDLFYEKDYNEEEFMHFDDNEENNSNSPTASSLDLNRSTTSYHIKKAEDALAKLKLVVDQPGWQKLLTHKSGMAVYAKADMSKDDKVPIFRGEHIIKGFTPQSIFAVIGTRKLWDDWYEEGSLVANLNETTSLTYMVIQALAGSKARDLSLVEKIECAYEGKIYFVSTSINTPKIPHIANRIRARLLLNGWILEPLSYNPPVTKVNYILQTNVKGWIPSVLAKKYLSRRPLVIHTIETYLRKNGPPTMFINAPSSNVEPSQSHSHAPTTSTPIANQTPSITFSKSIDAKVPEKNKNPHRHSKTLRAAMKSFKSQAKSLSGWELHSDNNGLKIYTKNADGKPTLIMRGELRITGGFTAEDILSIISDIEMRKVWDERFEDGVVVERLNHFDILVKTTMKGTFPIRDLSLVSSTEHDFETGIVRFVSTSVVDQLIPETRKHVRANLKFAGFELIPKFDDNGFTKYVDIKYIVDIDIKLETIPYSILKQVSIQTPMVLVKIDELLQKSGFPPYIRESTSQTSMKSCLFNTKTFDCEIEVVNTFSNAVTELKTSRKMYPNGYELTIQPVTVKVELLPNKVDVARITFPSKNEVNKNSSVLKIKIKKNTSKKVNVTYNETLVEPSEIQLKNYSDNNNENKEEKIIEEKIFRHLTKTTTTTGEGGEDVRRISINNINNLNDHFASFTESLRFNSQQVGLMFASMLLAYYAGKLSG
ncbi:8226_t:CDS:2 [Entrophospora sp. SA101]|nr:8226_t:CDS:2 [Entrophospora sp. SA101]